MRSIYDNVNASSFIVASGSTAAVITSAVTDTANFDTAVLRVFTSNLGAGLGVGTGASLAAVLQESAATTGPWTSATDNTGAVIQVIQTATTTAVIGSARVEGLGLNRKRYLRIQATVNAANIPAAGTIPALQQFTSCAVLEFGRAQNLPVSEGIPVSNT